MKRNSSKNEKKTTDERDDQQDVTLEAKRKAHRQDRRSEQDPTVSLKQAVAEALRHAEAEYHCAQLHLRANSKSPGARQRYFEAQRNHICIQEAAMLLPFTRLRKLSGS